MRIRIEELEAKLKALQPPDPDSYYEVDLHLSLESSFSGFLLKSSSPAYASADLSGSFVASYDVNATEPQEARLSVQAELEQPKKGSKPEPLPWNVGKNQTQRKNLKRRKRKKLKKL